MNGPICTTFCSSYATLLHHGWSSGTKGPLTSTRHCSTCTPPYRGGVGGGGAEPGGGQNADTLIAPPVVALHLSAGGCHE